MSTPFDFGAMATTIDHRDADLLATLARRPGQDLLFASSANTPITIFSDYKRTLDARLAKDEAEAALEEGREPVAMPEWKYHDFRRSGVTALAGLGFAPHVCDRLLNHVTGAIQGVAAVYQRAEFLAERKAALEAWAGFVTAPENALTKDKGPAEAGPLSTPR